MPSATWLWQLGQIIEKSSLTKWPISIYQVFPNTEVYPSAHSWSTRSRFTISCSIHSTCSAVAQLQRGDRRVYLKKTNEPTPFRGPLFREMELASIHPPMQKRELASVSISPLLTSGSNHPRTKKSKNIPPTAGTGIERDVLPYFVLLKADLSQGKALRGQNCQQEGCELHCHYRAYRYSN
jgi:hypothetical protein